MSHILIKTSYNFANASHSDNQKPIFFKWIPTEKDYILVNIGDTANLRMWFEGISEIPNQKETYTADKLTGKLKINDIDSELMDTLERSKSEQIEYEEFGKKVVKKMIYPVISNFLDLLRVNYGQYWVKKLQPWNSLEIGLGQYCRMLNMNWSRNDKDWFEFIPAKRVLASMPFRIVGESFYQEFLLKEDWNQIAELIHKDYEPTIAAALLNRAHILNNQGDLRASFLEGVSALELAIKEFIESKIPRSESVTKAMNQFWEMGLPSKVISIGLASGIVSSSDMENTIKAIDIRNKITHEGWEPENLELSKLVIMGLFRTVSGLLSAPKFKFPENVSVIK
jgi:hypothetical protein